jgi:hypothetical protein
MQHGLMTGFILTQKTTRIGSGSHTIIPCQGKSFTLQTCFMYFSYFLTIIYRYKCLTDLSVYQNE